MCVRVRVLVARLVDALIQNLNKPKVSFFFSFYGVTPDFNIVLWLNDSIFKMNILRRCLPLFPLKPSPLWATNGSHSANQIELKKIRHTINNAPKFNFLKNFIGVE